MLCSPSHIVITFALWQGAPSCWKRHCSSPNCSWMVGRSCSRRMFWHYSLFIAVFLGKIVSEPSPFAVKQPPTWMVSGCFTVGMTQNWWSCSSFLLRTSFFSQKLQTIGKEIHQRKWLYTSPQQSNPCTCCRISVCPWSFSWREVASLPPFLTPGHPPKVFASLSMQIHSHLPAAIPEQALHWWCPNPAAESTLGDCPGICWTFLGALKPSSQQFNLSPWSSWWSDKWLV